MKKFFVLDTNVLLHNAACIESFADNTVVLPMAVLEELDKFKAGSDELGRNARQVIRRIDALRARGRLGEGVPMDNGGTLKIVLDSAAEQPAALAADIRDNRIIAAAYSLHKSGERVIFVSKDINARVKADALGITVMDFEKQKVNFDELYTGYRKLELEPAALRRFRAEGRLALPGAQLLPNEFAELAAKGAPADSALGRADGPEAIAALSPQSEAVWNIKPHSPEQRMALELLMDEEVPLVTLVGRAGTGKTLLALAAGLEQTAKTKRYDKMLISRPVIPLGKDIGFLPGDKESKLLNWMQPIFDNLAYLMRRDAAEKKFTLRERIEKLQRDRVVELEALTYIRGRSLSGQYIVIDEAQNLTPHEIKTIVSRCGESAKMVLTGDPYQIDNPYLDSNSNGLTYSVERLKTAPLHGHVTLMKSERSPLSALAAEIL